MSKSATFLKLLSRIGPMVLSVIPATAPIAPYVQAAIAEAEVIPGASGAEKRAHAISLTTKVREALITQGIILPPDVTEQAIGDGIDATVGAINVIAGTHRAASLTQNLTQPTNPSAA